MDLEKQLLNNKENKDKTEEKHSQKRLFDQLFCVMFLSIIFLIIIILYLDYEISQLTKTYILKYNAYASLELDITQPNPVTLVIQEVSKYDCFYLKGYLGTNFPLRCLTKEYEENIYN